MNATHTHSSMEYWADREDATGETVLNGLKTVRPHIARQCAAAGDLTPRWQHYVSAQQRRMRLKYGLDYNNKKLGEYGQDYYNRVMA